MKSNNNFYARASRLGDLMTNGRGKNAGMGQTAMTYVREQWIADFYNRQKIVRTKFMTKGIEVEEDSLTLYTQVTGNLLTKNENNLRNNWITGTPDATTKNEVIDIKSSWDIWTFATADMNKAYEWQLRAYMMLLDIDSAVLAYCLVDTPSALIIQEQKKLYYDFDCDDNNPEYIELADQIERNMTFGDIPPEQRLKLFHIERDMEMEEQIKNRVSEAREYYNNLTL